MDLNTLLVFGLASLSINLIPGPDVVYIVSNTMKGQLKLGIEAALGLGVGYLLHTVAAVLGLSALILSSTLLFNIVKYIGAAYLLYLGISSILNAYRGQSSFIAKDSVNDSTSQNVFKQGVIVSIFNPKVAMFFLAFLPQFIDITSATATKELVVLGLLFTVLATGCNVVYACLGHVMFNNAQALKYARGIEAGSGFILLGLGTKVALSDH
ncbi:MAG: LysE family translocator [Gammaproteobacteria bacterium]|nr:LysE family translocator [Gammaproteobacteria bacterium]